MRVKLLMIMIYSETRFQEFRAIRENRFTADLVGANDGLIVGL